jgi:hypothetical protein
MLVVLKEPENRLFYWCAEKPLVPIEQNHESIVRLVTTITKRSIFIFFYDMLRAVFFDSIDAYS